MDFLKAFFSVGSFDLAYMYLAMLHSYPYSADTYVGIGRLIFSSVISALCHLRIQSRTDCQALDLAFGLYNTMHDIAFGSHGGLYTCPVRISFKSPGDALSLSRRMLPTGIDHLSPACWICAITHVSRTYRRPSHMGLCSNLLLLLSSADKDCSKGTTLLS